MSNEGLRTRRRRELMAQINEVALRLLAEKGYSAVSLQEVADEADISLRTLFRHFPNKDAIFGYETERREAEILKRLSTRPKDEPLIESYLFAIGAMIDAYMADPAVAQREFGILHEVPGLRAQYLVSSGEHEIDAMDAELADRLGCESDDGRIHLLRYCMVNAVVQATLLWQRNQEGSDLHTIMRSYIGLFEGMIEKIRTSPKNVI